MIYLSYRALYRVWRPGDFSELVGQDHISNTLRKAVLQNRVSHASLFSGPRGTGKTSMAKIMGKALNCLDLQEGQPCNKCANCLAINDGSFLDYFEIDAASNRGIDEIRDMRERVKFAPSQGRIKVYVIDEVHMLTNEAFNALLKTLEEPPAHVVFILATTEIHKIPLTILSRCQRFDFKKISEETIKKRLEEIIIEEKLSVEDSALDLIAKKAEGGLRDAISILDQGISASENDNLTLEATEELLGSLNEEELYKLFAGLFHNELAEVFTSLDNYQARGKEIKQIVKDMADYLREIILCKVSKKDGRENIKELAAMREQIYLTSLLKDLIDAEQKMYFFSRPRIILEAVLLDRDHVEKVSQTVSQIQQSKKTSQPHSGPAPETSSQVKEAGTKAPAATPDWDEILALVKKEKIMLHACLLEAEFSIKGNEAYLSFPENKKFHKDRSAQPENRELLEKILEKKYNVKLNVFSVFEGQEAKDISEAFNPDTERRKTEEKETKKEKTEESDALAEALKIFDAEIVEIKD